MYSRNRVISSLSQIALVFVVFAVMISASNAWAETIVLRSGNAPVGNTDPFITMLVGSGATPLAAQPFTPTEFDMACSGPSAVVCQPHPAWASQLPCDPEAKWIGIDAVATPSSALYCYNFDVETCCIERATLSFCWVTDDVLGDLAGSGPNPDGVYLNGTALSPSIFGGNYATETVMSGLDVTDLLHCGTNSLQVYNRDLGFAVSGVMFSTTIDIIECATPTESSTWGAVKSLFR